MAYMEPLSLKCVFVGDSGVGKTSLLLRYFAKADCFPTENVPKVLDDFATNLIVEKQQPVKLHVWDTAGQADDFPFQSNLTQKYFSTDVVVICFSVADPVTFENITTKWIPEVLLFCPGKPIILLGMKTDLRRGDVKLVLRQISGSSKPSQQIVTQAQGKILAREVGAAKYLECSTLTGQGVNETFLEAIMAALIANGHFLPKKCSLM